MHDIIERLLEFKEFYLSKKDIYQYKSKGAWWYQGKIETIKDVLQEIEGNSIDFEGFKTNNTHSNIIVKDNETFQINHNRLKEIKDFYIHKKNKHRLNTKKHWWYQGRIEAINDIVQETLVSEKNKESTE
ncbi:hypothetical protein ACTWQB_17070 [Piscibacillus sp. B03]|uniref:hypothetical protein n=1 Tax=Piscibacillus sp. B03 TaxID=3457430 RepID=UPI003FCCE640